MAQAPHYNFLISSNWNFENFEYRIKDDQEKKKEKRHEIGRTGSELNYQGRGSLMRKGAHLRTQYFIQPQARKGQILLTQILTSIKWLCTQFWASSIAPDYSLQVVRKMELADGGLRLRILNDKYVTVFFNFNL